MLTLFIIIILAIAFYTGARRGLVLQIVLTVGYMISLTVAKKYYLIVADKIELLIPYPSPTAESKLVFFKDASLFKLDEAFYAGLAFILLLMLGWAATRFIGILCHNLTFFPVIKQANLIGGGFLSLIVAYMAIFFFLYVLSMIPLDFIQNLFRGSSLARLMIEKTPFFSNQVYEWWVTAVAG